MAEPFDRTAADIGNLLLLEHVNVRVTDLQVAKTFYVHGLGCTFDPFIDHGPNVSWFNFGGQQFHVPKASRADVLRGVIGLRVPSVEGLERRLADIAPSLSGSEFSYDKFSYDTAFAAAGGGIDVVGPWVIGSDAPSAESQKR